MTKQTDVLLEFIKYGLYPIERKHLSRLLSIDDPGDFNNLLTAALQHGFTTIHTLLNAVELQATKPMPIPVNPNAQLEAEFTSHEINVLTRKLGLPIGYAPMRTKLDNIRHVQKAHRWSLETLRSFCDTRARPSIKKLGALGLELHKEDTQ